ncbi:hypothetical protein, partial [Pseudomonas sp. MH10]
MGGQPLGSCDGGHFTRFENLFQSFLRGIKWFLLLDIVMTAVIKSGFENAHSYYSLRAARCALTLERHRVVLE